LAAVNLDETVSSLDNNSSSLIQPASNDELLSASENNSCVAIQTAALTDSLTASETYRSGGETISGSVIESASAIDDCSCMAIFTGATNETGTALDNSSIRCIYLVFTSETSAATEQSDRQYFSNCSILESVQAIDNQSLSLTNPIYLKFWNGSEWLIVPLKTYLNNQWNKALLKIYNGSVWRTVRFNE
jgi:hypothetical protein